MEWLLPDMGFIPHGHCMQWLTWLISSIALSNLITIIEYWVIALICMKVAVWGRSSGHWRAMWHGLAFVFISCSLNYLMMSLVIFWPLYITQAVLSWVGTIVSFKCIYHLFMIGKGPLQEFVRALSMAVRGAGL